MREGRLFEERRLFQISCPREVLNRRGALIRERALIRSNTVCIEHFQNAIKISGHRACFGTTWIAIDNNYTTRKVFLRNPSNQK